MRKSKDIQHNEQKKKYKQRSTKHTHKTKDRVTRTPLMMSISSKTRACTTYHCAFDVRASS